MLMLLRERAQRFACAAVGANVNVSPGLVKAGARGGRQGTGASGGTAYTAPANKRDGRLGERQAVAMRAATRAAQASDAPKSAQPKWLAGNIKHSVGNRQRDTHDIAQPSARMSNVVGNMAARDSEAGLTDGETPTRAPAQLRVVPVAVAAAHDATSAEGCGENGSGNEGECGG